MRTRIYNKMTEKEVEDYLARGGDTMFLAIGVVECHGALPIDCETVAPEAYAKLLAEKADGLAMINMPYFYPGGTNISNATIQMSVRGGIDYLMQICHSLVDQGFKRLFLISGHGPSVCTIDAFCVDFMAETLIHPCHLMSMFIGRDFDINKGLPGGNEDYMLYGAYKIMGQMEYLPIVPDSEETSAVRSEVDPVMDRFSKLYAANRGFTAQVYSDPSQHGGGIIFRSEEERLEICTKGEEQMRSRVDNCNIIELKEALGEYQDYIQRMYEKYPRIKAK